MKTLRNGQLCTINNKVYRVKRRTCGCEGCFFEDSFFLCPGVLDRRTKKQKINCQLYQIILQPLIKKGET